MKYKIKSYTKRTSRSNYYLIKATAIIVLGGVFCLETVQAQNPSGDLRVEIMSAYNFVVDSNVESPSTYAPRAAYLGAKIYNDGTNDLTDVYAYIGCFTNNTPGIYPSRAHPPLVGPIQPGNEFALTHEGGSSGTRDATRYLGNIPAGEFVAVYWLVSYPNVDENGDAVWGPSVKPEDDLWLTYDIWAKADDAGTPLEADTTRKITMRNEISAAANKIFPNGANKVPDAYKELLEQYNPSWTNMYSDGTPGTRIWTEGIWYDLGNVGAGFDNDGDLVPDKNAWMQPVGDPTVFDASSFRLVRTYAMVIVKLKSGGEEVYNVQDQLYFQNIPENNGAVGLVRYEFLPLKQGASSALTPYQEVASGFDNEKFNGDYGASIGSGIESGSSKVQVDKTGNVTIEPGGTIDYQISFTNSGFVKVGDPKLNSPLVIVDVVPTGTTYVAGSATSSNVLPAGVGSYTVLFSTNNGASWTDIEPGNVADITDIQWWLSAEFDTNAFGKIGFSVNVDNPFSNSVPYIENEGGGTFGGGPPFTNTTVITKVQGTNEVGDTVFLDNGAGGGTLGNGTQDGTEVGISNITVSLYFDTDGNGSVGSSDILMGTDVTDTNGKYLFDLLGDGNYVVIVDDYDPDLPTGSAVTRPVTVAVALDTARTNSAKVSYLDADFAFAPVLALDKSIVGGAVTNREGSTITYQLLVTNSLQGTGGYQTYDVWAQGEIVSAKPWDFPENVYFPPGPDGIYSTNDLEAATEVISLTDFQLGTPDGTISNVKVVIAMDVVGTFNGDDSIEIQVLERGGPTFFLTNIIANLLVTNIPAMIVNNELVLEATTNRTWTWSDFNGTNIVIQLDAKKAGGPNAGAVLLDATGFRIQTDWVGGGSDPSLTLNPVPLFDTFDAGILNFSSSDFAPSSVTTNGSIGTIYWNNIGPLYEGGYEAINVTFDVLEPSSNITANTTNTASITNAWYGDGRPANSVTDKVTNVILPAGSIGDFVWRDMNGNGTNDGGNETGISGVYVVLTPPAGVNLGNGAGNPITNITDASGYYLFKGLPADGNYTVTVRTNTLPGGSGTPTYDEDGGNDNTCVVTLDYDATDGTDTYLTADFGYTVLTMIEGTVWHDLNRDGDPAPDVGEQWLTNVTVYLFSGSTTGPPATAIATNYTTINGYYRFVGNYGGNYTVQVVTNSGSMSGSTWTRSFDTDGIGTANYVPLTVVTGGTARADFSYYKTGSYSIGDFVFYDWNGNGTNEVSDEGIPNVKVSLYEDEDGDGTVDSGIDGLIGSQSTGANGNYLFSNLPSNNYIVIVDQNDPDMPDQFLNTADPYGINDGQSRLLLTTNRLDQDFGYKPLGNGSIGDTVWYDKNGDGIQLGPLETGLGSITVTLLANFNGDTTYVTITNTETDASGKYLFNNLPDGNYIARVTTTDTNIPTDGFGQRYVITTDTDVYVTISNGNSYLDADFGFTALGAIGDTIFWDANRNGTQDYNEDGIKDVTVRLYNDVNGDGYYTAGTDSLYGSDITDADGKYLFTGLPIGKYVVYVVQSGPIAGTTLMADPNADGLPATDPDATGVDGEYGLSIYAGTSFMGADFGYAPPGVLGDRLWLDTNNDGVQDANELGISYITIQLWSNGTLIATNETDSSGEYMFQNLPDGTYTIIVDTNDTDWSPKYGPTYDPDGTLDDRGSLLVISNGVLALIDGTSVTNADLDIDFGYRFTGTNILSGTVGLETTVIDGKMGFGASGYNPTNEVPYSDIAVYLYLWNDDGDNVIEPGESELISSTLTITNGDYTFTDLPEGDGNDAYIISLYAPERYLDLTTTNASTPATNVVETLDSAGNTVSAYQVIPIYPVITEIDFAFVSKVNYDFGDLPSIYSTLIQDDPAGPRHKIKGTPDLYLGSTIDVEPNGQPAAAADGDGADEDGVTRLGVWQNGTNGQIEVVVGAGNGWIVGFIDFNNDGDLTDAGEMIFSREATTNGNGTYTNTFIVNTNTISATNTTSLYARFRLFKSEPGFPAFESVGQADNGEVEDYYWRFGALGDYVWRDTDADGIQDASEAPIADARVFVDLNNDGAFQTGEPNDVTDTNGYYYIGGFCPGTYKLMVDTNTISTNIWPSYDLDLDVTGTPHYASVVMTNGQVRADVDFGYQTLVLGGLIWHDFNEDGIQNETNFTTISGITVHLLDAQSNLLASTASDTNGTYLFDVEEPGNYIIQFFPIQYKISPKDQGGDDSLDSDAALSAPYKTDLITLETAQRQTNWDLGVYLPSVTNSIGDYVWFDYDRDGIQDAGEPGIQNITVTLYDGQTNVIDTTLTDVAGNYYFAGLMEDNYFVGFSKPASYLFSPANQGGNDNVDSDANTTTGYSPVYFITNGFLNHSIDAGMYGIIDLGVTKSVSDVKPNAGDIIQYSMTVSNAGPAGATQVRLADTWPTNITLTGAAPSQGTFLTGSNIWNLGSLAVAQVETLVITGQVHTGTGGKSITNRITVIESYEPDTNPANNTASSVLVVEYVDVGVRKSVAPTNTYEGSNVIYTIVATNNGPDIATGVQIKEPLTNWISYVSHIASTGTYNSVTGIWNIGTMDIGSYQTLTITAHVDSGAGGRSITNVSTVHHVDQEDSNPTNNSSKAYLVVVGAELGIKKSVDNNKPNESDTIKYTISVTNNGPNNTTGVKVYEPLASGLNYQSHSTTNGTYSTNDWIWNIGNLDLNKTATLTIDCWIGGGTKFTYITNISTIVTNNLPDPNPGNNTATQIVGVADIGIKKWSNIPTNGYAYRGSNITYTIAVTNKGVPPHYNVTVTDPLPDGVTFVPNSCYVTRPFYTNSYCRDNFGTVVYNNSDGLLPWTGSWQEIGDDGNVSGGDVQVLADGTNAYVLSIENGTKGAMREANLSAWKWAELSFKYRRNGLDNTNDFVAVHASSNNGTSWTQLALIAGGGTDASYLSTNCNLTPFITTNILIRFLGNAGLGNNDFVYFDDVNIAVSQRVYRTVSTNGPATLCTNLTLLEDEYLIFTYDVQVDNPPDPLYITNTAYVTTELMPDPRESTVIDVVEHIDLGVTKDISDDHPGTNALIWYTIELTNSGPQVAHNIVLTDIWPSNITFLSAEPSVGTYNSTNHKWSIASLSAGGQASLSLTGQVDVLDYNIDITNTIYISSVDEYDSNPLNNTDQVAIVTLAVISRFEAGADEEGPYIEWETASEIGTAGFHLYRQTPSGDYEKACEHFLPAEIGAPQGSVYRLYDSSLNAGEDLTYVLTETEFEGKKRNYGPFDVTIPDDAVAVNEGISFRSEPRTSELSSARRAAREKAVTPLFTLNMAAESTLQTISAAAEIQKTGAGEGEFAPVKISIEDPGVYTVTAADIVGALGMTENTIRTNILNGEVSLTCQGASVALSRADDGSSITFAADGIESIYTKHNVYILDWTSFTGPGSENGGAPSPVSSEQVFVDTLHFEENINEAKSITRNPEDDFWLWTYTAVYGSTAKATNTYPAVIPSPGTAPATANVKVRLQGLTSSGVADEHQAEIYLNDTFIGETNWMNITAVECSFDISQSLLTDGTNTLKMVSILNPAAGYSYIYMDSFEITYNRQYLQAGGQLTFTGYTNAVVTVSGFNTTNIVVFNVTTANAPAVVNNTTIDSDGGSNRVSFAPASSTDKYTAFVRNSGFSPVSLEKDGIYDLKSTNNKAMYMVITHEDLKSAAQSLADYRSNLGLESTVVMVEDIYDDFSHGIHTPHALKDFIKYTQTNWAQAPIYVVLAGSGTTDYKDNKGYGENLIDTMIVDTPYGLASSDSWFVDIDDDKIPDIAIGRLPALYNSELQGLVDKIKSYENTSRDSWLNNVILAADQADEGGNFKESSDKLQSIMPGKYSQYKIYLDDQAINSARTTLFDALNSGSGFMNYFGHAGWASIGNYETLLEEDDMPLLLNSNKLTIITSMTCIMGQFSMPGYDCLAETLLLHTNGGAVAVWSPTDLAEHRFSEMLSSRFYEKSLSGKNAIIGNVILEAMQSFASERDTRYLLEIYTLLGDPAMIMTGISNGEYPYENVSVNYTNWEYAVFTAEEETNSLVSNWDADPDGDGIANLMEYAMGLNPTEANTGGSLVNVNDIERTEDETYDAVIAYTRLAGAGDVQYVIEVSSDFITWTSDPEYIVSTQVVDDGNNKTETVYVYVKSPAGDRSSGFIRLKVIKP